jgi:hypothetical protein
MKYIAVLLLLIAGMFYFGDRINQSPELTYSSTPNSPLSSTYTRKEYCEPEIDEEVARYEAQLNAAYSKIYQLNNKLTEMQSATLSAEAIVEKPSENL